MVGETMEESLDSKDVAAGLARNHDPPSDGTIAIRAAVAAAPHPTAPLPPLRPGESESADYNGRILWPLARAIEDRHGAKRLAELASLVGLPVETFDGRTAWISAQRFEAFLAGAYRWFPNEKAFQEACTHRMLEAYGPLRFILRAASPLAVLRQAVRTYSLVSSVGTLSIRASARNWAEVEIVSDRPFSRLVCLARQAQSSSLTTLWGLPAAAVHEHSCIAKGDATCRMTYKWFEIPRSTTAVFLGALVFAGTLTAPIGWMARALTAALVAALVYVTEIRRVERANADYNAEMVEALKRMANEEAEVRREMIAMTQRQKDWSRILEEEALARTERVQGIVESMRTDEHNRVTRIRGVSHDIKGPINVVVAIASYLKSLPDIEVEPLDELEAAAWRINQLVNDLMALASDRKPVVTVHPVEVDVEELGAVIRRRLHALAYGREIKTTVFETREAPRRIVADTTILDRVFDNILGNAAKYTERGSIVVEIDGRPDHAVFKVSDTGRGMDDEQLVRNFSPGGSKSEERKPGSHGVGLSVVVSLLGLIGGKLEIMSQLNEGTTFWIHIPTVTADKTSQPPEPVESYDDTFRRVVSIRKKRA